ASALGCQRSADRAETPRFRVQSHRARSLPDMSYPKGRMQPKTEAAQIARLTAREREVIALVGEGLRNTQIAQRLSLSETTVRRHLTAIWRKLGVADRLDLILYAYRHGLAQIPQ